MKKYSVNKISKIAIAVGLGVMMCGAAVSPAFADDHGRGHQEERHGDQGRGDDRDRGGVYVAPVPDYYYAPQPNYYYAPEPDYYNYNYPPQPEYYPPPPSQGIDLFFGF
ncbi:MAG: hypothetical protein WCA22_09550 [Candidatus Binatus sp.]